jgi:hypothetical protein
MGFNAEKVVDPLDYDLTAVGGPKGRVPEPSDKVVFALQEDLRSGLTAQGIDISDLTDMGRIAKQITALEPEQQTQYLESQLAAVARFCGGSPTLEQLQELPYRIRNAFVGWLVGEFNPER